MERDLALTLLYKRNCFRGQIPDAFHSVLHYFVTCNIFILRTSEYKSLNYNITQIAKFMEPTWGPPGPCRPQMGPCWPHEPCYEGNVGYWRGYQWTLF